ncbi:N-ethylammeline chlorohydrolase [Desulfosarcina alkanivorans]|uniref:5-methylthioadenosine/S-adenosylhomocysteine deaminase n=1 Tax=Desulfosarcina alkanivorans TaxID=571177 RepID=A0A5K7YSJ8_9BACT|nr:amidohydrolase [Desulfosarcina alkanivorans]BBO69234.1 N-ethylammeline chlorohydrolase [Desulfosarcina alkanivorans]
MGFDVVIHNGTLVTVDRHMRVIENGWIGIEADVIRAVESGRPGTPPPGAGLTIDAAGGIVMPGLVNTHTHLPMSLFRGLADDLPLEEWLDDHIFPAEARFIRPDTVHWGTLLSCAELLLSGTTCCCGGYFHEDAVARAVAETGMRAVLAQGVIDFPAPGVPDPAQNIVHARVYAHKWKGGNPLITPSIFCHSPYTCSDDTLKAAKAEAEASGLLYQVHVAETRFERDQSLKERGMTPVARLDRLGLIDRRTLMAHCVWVDDADIDIIARRNGAVSHCPESNMKLASGSAPVAGMLKAGIRVSLGTDGCASNNNLDLFGEMDTAAKLHKLTTGNPTTLGAGSALSMATIDGARAIGLADRIGSLEIGKQADVIILEARAPHLTPLYHPESHIVYAACGADVRHVLVAGRQVVKNRRMLTLNVPEIMDRVNAIAREIRSNQ